MNARSYTIETRGRSVPLTFRPAGPDPQERLAIVLPGAGYTCDMPLLFHTTELLLEEGVGVLLVEENVSRIPAWLDAPTIEKLAWAVDTTTAVLENVGSEHASVRDLTLVGKSLGTYALGYLLAERPHLLERTERTLWLTPSLRDRWDAMREAPGRNLAVIGTSDPRYDAALPHLPEDRIVIEGAGHGMEFPGDPVRGAKAMSEIVERIQEWLHIPR